MGIPSWKPVVGFEDFYLVNSVGEVLSLRTGLLRKPVKNPQNGYNTLVLCGDHIKKTVYIHRLVAEAFIDAPDDDETIRTRLIKSMQKWG